MIGVVASSHYVAAGPTTLFTETWTGADGSAWNATRWPNIRGGTFQVSGNKGIMPPASPVQAYNNLTVTDFDAVVKCEWDAALGGAFPEIAWRIGANVSSGTGSNGYVMQVNGNTGRIDIFKVSAYTSIANSAADATIPPIGGRMFRVHVVGNNHKVRWWPIGGAEPGTWQLDVNDATYTTGAFGLRNYSGNNLIWDDLTITTP